MTSKPEAPLPAIVTEEPTGYSLSQRAAEQCREIVESTAKEIEGRRYVEIAGWQAIAIAHGCVASARDVEAVYEKDALVGYRAVGEVRRMSDGVVIATGEGFVGVDEPVWFGGRAKTRWGTKDYAPRPKYAIKAMAQTRGISRACRSAFAHVVVIINKDLSTTPAEEMDTITVVAEAVPAPPPPAPSRPEPPPPPPPLPPMKEDAERMSRASGYKPGDRYPGQHRKGGAPPTQAEIERKKIDQLDAAFDWVKAQAPALSLMTFEEVEMWKQEPEVAARIKAMEQGKDGIPGYEHLGPAWDRLQEAIDVAQRPPK